MATIGTNSEILTKHYKTNNMSRYILLRKEQFDAHTQAPRPSIAELHITRRCCFDVFTSLIKQLCLNFSFYSMRIVISKYKHIPPATHSSTQHTVFNHLKVIVCLFFGSWVGYFWLFLTISWILLQGQRHTSEKTLSHGKQPRLQTGS